jgi:DNA-binding transcriptional LysR family regulator
MVRGFVRTGSLSTAQRLENVMDTRLLSRLVTVAELGSINRAAEHLHISQPALSKSIRLLEDHFSIDLLHRGPRGVNLTTYGQTVVLHAKAIDAELRKLDREIDILRNVSIGEVNVGVLPGPGFISHVLTMATLRLVKSAPCISVNYQLGSCENLLQPLRQGDLDFIVTNIVDDDTTDDLVKEHLFQNRGAIVVHPGHSLSKQPVTTVADICQYPWAVLFENSNMETMLRQMAKEAGTQFDRTVIRNNSSVFVKSTLMQSDFVGLIAYDSVRIELEKGLLVEVALDDSTNPAKPGLFNFHMVSIVYRKDTVLSTTSRALIREIKAECRVDGRFNFKTASILPPKRIVSRLYADNKL